MRVIDTLKDLMKGKAPGPLPYYTLLHLTKTIEAIGVAGSIGRKRLSRSLGLGETSTRTIVNRLKDAGLVDTSKAGCKLTKRGKAIYDELMSQLVQTSQIEMGKMCTSEHNVGILIRNASCEVRHGIEQYEAAIKAGAEGAMTFVYRKGRLVMPAMSDDLQREQPEIAGRVLKIFHPMENDVIIVGQGTTKESAEDGARAAALRTIESKA